MRKIEVWRKNQQGGREALSMSLVWCHHCCHFFSFCSISATVDSALYICCLVVVVVVVVVVVGAVVLFVSSSDLIFLIR